MPSTATRPELIDAALSRLGLPGAGQANSAEDVAKMDEIVDRAIEDLVGQEVIRLQDNDEFPLVIFNQLAVYCSELAAPDFGRPENVPMMERAMQQMRVAARGGPTYEVMRSEYF